MSIQSILTEPPKKQRHPVLLYIVWLLVFLSLFFSIWVFYTTQAMDRHDPYRGLVVPIMLLLNLMAFQISWKPIVTAILRITSIAWTIFGLFYIFYWSHILFK